MVPPPEDAAAAVKAANLRYVGDDMPGIRRRRAGRGFVYIGPNGSQVGDPHTLDRIRGIVIPPAWQRVWICARADGHIQATGYDARGRKQYRYHAEWRRVRDETKYERLADFARRLPALRRHIARDLARRGLPRQKVLATVVRLLETTLIRIGNAEYARTNGSFGLTTMRARHAEVTSSSVRFRFKGKSGKVHEVGVHDRQIARIVGQCQELPGQDLLQYVDDEGHPVPIESADVNAYVREIAGDDVSAKDFRTWAGTVLAAMALNEMPVAESKTACAKQIAGAIRRVSRRLGNTPAVCRSCYVHPAVLDAHAAGWSLGKVSDLRAAERGVLALLERGVVTAPKRASA
jgi:DNA topoisomerase-1